MRARALAHFLSLSPKVLHFLRSGIAGSRNFRYPGNISSEHITQRRKAKKNNGFNDIFLFCRFTAVWGQTRPTSVLVTHPFPKVLPASLIATFFRLPQLLPTTHPPIMHPTSLTSPTSRPHPLHKSCIHPLHIPPFPPARVGRSGGVREYYGQKRGGKSGLIPFPRCRPSYVFSQHLDELVFMFSNPRIFFQQ